jgi:HlyD family secretion protein
MDISRKKWLLTMIVLLVFATGIVTYLFFRTQPPSHLITIYGNIDIRQVQLAFYDNGRILNLYVQEGDRVRKGQLLAKLDPIRFLERVAQNQGQVSAQEAAVSNAEITLQRRQALAKQEAASKQSLDDAIANLKIAQHTLQAYRAALAIAKQELVDSQLYAPQDGVVQNRILELGDMVTPQNSVFTLALDNPVWARAYLPEKALGHLQLGMKAWILNDSFPGQRFPGWLGFISPTAEFTPKTVETTELRTKLVYQVRVYACNPDHHLRLGMPVTVEIPLKNNQPQTLGANPCGS